MRGALTLASFASFITMITLRPLLWPADRAAVLSLDTSFVTDRIFQLEVTSRSITLKERKTTPPTRKTYPLEREVDALPGHSWVQVAVDGDAVVGLAAVGLESWNRRARLEHLYVDPAARRRGVGLALVEAAFGAAGELGARGLWVETQATNYGAIRFYERAGFTWCGVDMSMYDPDYVNPGEVAVFLWRALP